ncbi:MAG: HAMP domain-containing protein [Deltaproteobacteria bacterium]|nr:HAMP domain-containing protein [Deltaproteobacteria bacterium]
MKQGHGLQRRMTFYLVFLATVFLTLAAEITSFLRGPRVTGALTDVAGTQAGRVVAAVVSLIVVKVWVMLGILLAALALVFFLFMKKVTGPLRRILEATDEISAGNLSVQVSVVGADELGRLAQGINGLAANTQELLLLSRQVAARAQKGLGRVRSAPDGVQRAEALAELEGSIEELERLIEEFGQSFFSGAPHP